MAARTGVPAIRRLLISLAVVSAIVCGAIYVVVSPPRPIIKPAVREAPSRTLAYQQQIDRPGEEAPAQNQGAAQKHAMAPADTAPPSQPAQGAPAPASQPKTAAPAPPQPQAGQQGQPSDMAGLPPDDGGVPYDPNALPWQHGGNQYRPAQPGPEAGLPGASPGEGGYQGGYNGPQQDAEAWPGGDADPNAWPGGPQGPQDEPQEWVQVLVSGAGMYGLASEDSPMLFAFPYGRTLRAVSHYGNWVEVIDPQSATTGWMKAQYLAPVAAPRSPQEAEAWYGDEPPRRHRRGWFRRAFGF
jgi:hypothetical protein